MPDAAGDPRRAPAQAPSGQPPVPDVDAPLVRIPHTRFEDVLAILTGTFLAGLGLFFLRAAGVVTGGTAGVALLLSYVVDVPFGWLLVLVNLPFFVLALVKKGWRFTVVSAVCVVLLSVFAELFGATVTLEVPAALGTVIGSLVVGVGLLVLFRHGASLGGFTIVGLVLQDGVGWRAGYVQMVLDVAVIVCSIPVVGWRLALLSAGGAVLLNLVLALNHRPGRYLA